VQYAETATRWEQKAHNELPASVLLTGVREVSDAAMDHLGAVMTFLGAAGGSEGLVTRAYDKMVKHEGDPLATALLMGFDSAPVRGEKALYDLAQWCRAHPDLVEYLLNTSSQRISDQLDSEVGPEGVSEASWAAWQQRFEAYLKEFGFSIYDLDFGKPLPSDDPTHFLETLRMFISGDGKNPHERQQASAERREAAVNEAMSRLKGLKLKIFRMLLNWAQSLAPLREDGIANIGYGYPVLREMLFEIGRRLADRGVLAAHGDIFWLREDEVEQAVTALDAGLPVDSFTAPVEQRKAIWRARKSVTPPPQLPAKEKYMGFSTDLFLAHGEQVGDTIKGVAASPGRITAPARVLHGPEDFGQMQQGDVLVASITTPAWTPLFTMASAVVTDVGGPLSHGSIVAREYGIPAVLGTGVATRRIQSGQIITVDGTAGEVILSENGDSAA
jgi:pyruvate,water dikinase